jgi:putative membrane-bound dehydrogenase-like protein
VLAYLWTARTYRNRKAGGMAKHPWAWSGLALLPLFFAGTRAPAAEMPRLADGRYGLELVASEPDIVTPIGLAYMTGGSSPGLLVVESHTHQRPEGYQGPAGDRIRLFSDSDGDGRLDRWTTFADGFRFAMNVLPRPDGAVYVITRSNLVLLHDTDGDGKADDRRELVRLETADDYPHDGLESMDLTPDGALLFAMGENHGTAFRLIGADGSTIAGEGQGGSLYRCSQDGERLERIATGFWNPFGLCTLPDGRVFCADNDPDACPPCRLLHIVAGGDYGFEYRFGRAGTHPLQAWNGELPGTLPMVCGIGEAPTALVAHAGSLWVTSWGDHRIERYRLVPRGASYAAERQVVVQGDADFRPTGMAVAPDGSLYFGDWLLRDYEVHGRGRVWRLTLPADAADAKLKASWPPEPQLGPLDDSHISSALESADPFVRAAAVEQLSQRADVPPSADESAAVRLGRLEALRLRGTPEPEPILREALQDDSTDVRLFALRWIADERVTALRDDVAKLLDGPLPNPRYYLAVLATIDWLDNPPELRSAGITDGLLVRELRNDRRPPAARVLALRLLSPDDKFLTLPRFAGYLQSDSPPLRLEAVRSLAQGANPDRFELLASTAQDPAQSEAVRLEALAGLASAADRYHELLATYAAGKDRALSREAAGVLRRTHSGAQPSPGTPPADDLAAWTKLLQQPGDAESGRRLFFSDVGPRCAVCHQFDGRGGRIGPDLSHIGRDNSPARIIQSILEPSQEIAPQYQPWRLVTDDGKTYTGLRVAEPGDDGTEEYVDSAGQVVSLPTESIESRQASATSIMPAGLETTMSVDDLRDLLAFLTQPDDGGK